MSNQPRVVKVLGALLVSMTIGAFVLMALGNNPPSAGPFCLSAYYRLTSVDQAVQSKACQAPDRWTSIEIFFSGTKGGSLQQPAGAVDMNCHFVICNGAGGRRRRDPVHRAVAEAVVDPAQPDLAGLGQDHPHLPDRRRRQNAAHGLPTEAAGDAPGSPVPQVPHPRRFGLSCRPTASKRSIPRRGILPRHGRSSPATASFAGLSAPRPCRPCRANPLWPPYGYCDHEP